ncbi:RNA polymerase sigma factor [Mucilaginibacter sp. JRF]|uniref:RNA polymerase sigma factor n=1 Tax=Mucilaginibacter sp. JRF TaxID=2780088 RepID=UPI001D16575C|nr:RNA polymerase sigma factor [Mucilaginibacter sp. JRF]
MDTLATSIMPHEKQNSIIQTMASYGSKLFGFIRKRVKSEADAEDILQDVWYQLSSVVNAEPIEQTGAWLFKVARNKIIDKHKKKSESLLDDLAPEGDDDADDIGYFKDFLLTESRTPESEYIRGLFWDELFIALNELPEEQRQVFTWHELDAIPFSQIAEMTGEKEQTLVSRKRYAVLHLRKRLYQLYKEITEY